MKPSNIVIHHSLTADGQTVSWSAIRKYHVETLGWKDVGYHYGLEMVGSHYEIFAGRMMNEDGAHVKEQGMNSKSLGICLVGNFDLVVPLTIQLELTARLVRSLMEVFNIDKSNVYRHTDFAPYKSCPGVKFPWAQFKSMI